jgi:hypothetical protein
MKISQSNYLLFRGTKPYMFRKNDVPLQIDLKIQQR